MEHRKKPIAISLASDSGGNRMWRSLDEAVRSREFEEYLQQQFPRFADRFEFDRREFLKVMAASMALAGLGACSREPLEKILPYVKPPAESAYGEPRFYATAVTQGGYAMGVLVESHMGRPTKVEGNPLHPASLGATDVFAQASVLDVWDPDRSKTVTFGGGISTWDEFLSALQLKRIEWEKKQGDGLRLLTETVTSPTLAAQIAAFLSRFPKARWHQYEPLNRDAVHDGARLAFGETLETHYHFDKARVVLSLGGDFLDHGPGRIRHARDFMGVRANAATNGTGNRLYALFSTPNLTSAVADHGIALTSSAIEHAALRMVQLLGLPAPAAQPVTGVPEAWLSACVEDLKRSGKASLVVAGANQSPLMHALAHAMNKMLGSAGECVTYSAPVCANPENQTDSLRGLVHDMAAGNVDTLIVLGGNPLYSTPADSGFAEALSHVATSVHCGGYANETAARCHWHIPQAHFLEAWSDARAHDGTASIQQPLLAPLYGGRSPHELLAVLGGDTMTSGHDIVRGFWRSKLGADFETVWNTALRNGLVANTAFAARTATPKTDFLPLLPQPGGKLPVASLEVSFLPDASVWDGSYSNNAWLQELPRPFSKLTWDNAAYVSPTLAERLSLVNEDVVELSYRGRRVQAPIWITPGHADDTISVALGYGRTHAGRVGNGCGFNAYSLRTLDAPWFASGVEIRNTGKKYALSTTQQHHSMEGRDIVRVHALTAAGGYTKSSQKKREAAEGSLYPPFKYDGYAWGMAIDLSSCIGCNACTIACQAENNIPVVGKAEVARGREMHWIRVDRYYQGTPYRPRAHFQPVPCMQCENAPCEVVCPVEASVHDSEGLNVQVYNRCVGTRFCSNNCPYKVRRFNFYQYVDENTESLKAQRNPEVTVRMRGVMEKCSYCVQRIANARIEAEKDDRRIRDGDVVTACQAVCPTQAITFGDLNDPASRVNAVKASPLNYALLAELNTKPRTTYLAKLTNLNPAVRED